MLILYNNFLCYIVTLFFTYMFDSNMKNIFENAYFGKIYKTRDNRKALYINCSKKSNIHHLVVENDFMSERAYWEDGHNDFDRNDRKEDIVSEWPEN